MCGSSRLHAWQAAEAEFEVTAGFGFGWGRKQHTSTAWRFRVLCPRQTAEGALLGKHAPLLWIDFGVLQKSSMH